MKLHPNPTMQRLSPKHWRTAEDITAYFQLNFPTSHSVSRLGKQPMEKTSCVSKASLGSSSICQTMWSSKLPWFLFPLIESHLCSKLDPWPVFILSKHTQERGLLTVSPQRCSSISVTSFSSFSILSIHSSKVFKNMTVLQWHKHF